MTAKAGLTHTTQMPILLCAMAILVAACKTPAPQERATPTAPTTLQSATTGRTFRITDPKVKLPKELHSLWQYQLTDNSGATYSLHQHKGKVVLIVNTASHCGYTKQYEGLETLYRRYKDQGLVVIAVPCNQFGEQEPGTAAEIATFCKTTYDVSFPLMAKGEVNGTNTLPLYTFLKQHAPQNTGADIRWNFTKFLIGRDGKSVTRYESDITPESLEADIKTALQQ